jgi:hypothetical protein
MHFARTKGQADEETMMDLLPFLGEPLAGGGVNTIIARIYLKANPMPAAPDKLPPTWLKPDGTPVSCVEKIKVLNENIIELRQTAQDALEDAVLMGCSEAHIRAALHELIDELINPYIEDPPE